MSIHYYVNQAYQIADSSISSLLAVSPHEDLVFSNNEGLCKGADIYTVITRRQAVSLINCYFHSSLDSTDLKIENISLNDLNTLNALQSIYLSRLEARINEHLIFQHAKQILTFVDYTILKVLYPFPNANNYKLLLEEFSKNFLSISEGHFKTSKDIITWFFALRPNISFVASEKKTIGLFYAEDEAYSISLRFAAYADDYIDKDKLRLFIKKLHAWKLLHTPIDISSQLATANSRNN
ncbi:hypothetical protein DSM106972_095040 [Dulcicalothrix desertica PCC 7102]|uniref:Uncharacterized protein n=1 Tax=Dulcicalothrix desertica PCC 7102 TaxID=232991 RepID=A0A3S1I996_9CYAN|nr:hypothetical protein [Dulcicalothrix desertica]RUS93967.1 hypothetical protein DSM106972_095040 [Dulcicalothrix desertica PCC 7102]TWH62630.1 hypothetical protein CAL7102_00128 [Dulcicalothrix desertica PCC 7102]